MEMKEESVQNRYYQMVAVVHRFYVDGDTPLSHGPYVKYLPDCSMLERGSVYFLDFK